MQSVLLGQLGVDPEAFLDNKVTELANANIRWRAQYQFPRSLDRDLHGPASGAAPYRKLQIVHLNASLCRNG
ncbi:hypothetical protein [Methylomonas koyamae]|uniref:hypothetical protein n=1 Tax=Methylomonas koyamae TaxID=702114 RepID=UPI00210F3408|nr:hypothetical protein [Methylomonas koyamae]